MYLPVAGSTHQPLCTCKRAIEIMGEVYHCMSFFAILCLRGIVFCCCAGSLAEIVGRTRMFDEFRARLPMFRRFAMPKQIGILVAHMQKRGAQYLAMIDCTARAINNRSKPEHHQHHPRKINCGKWGKRMVHKKDTPDNNRGTKKNQ